MQAPAFYAERGIPKVRWMYPGKAYKARLITVPYKYDAAKMCIYVLNDKYVIAFRDEAMTQEIGMLKLEHFELFGYIDIDEPPHYESLFPISVTYGKLLTVPIENNAPVSTQVGPNEPKVDCIAPEEEPEKLLQVKVAVLPPDPPQEYEQLTLF